MITNIVLERKIEALELKQKNIERLIKKQDEKITDNAKYLVHTLQILEKIIPLIQTEENIDFTKILLAKLRE